MKKHILSAAALTLTLVLAATCATAAAPQSAGKWDASTLDTFRTLPIQEGGRVKPLDSYASFLLLRLNGKRTFTQENESGKKFKLSPMEWLLDCLFYPDAANGYRHFIVDNADYVTGLGARSPGQGQRQRFSYDDLLPARDELFKRGSAAWNVEQSKRTAQEAMLVALAQAVLEYESVTHYFDFARVPFNASQSKLAQKIFPGEESAGLTLSRMIEKGRDLRLAIAALQQLAQEPDSAQTVTDEVNAFGDFMRPLDFAGRMSTALSLIPPADDTRQEWLSVGQVVDQALPILAYLRGGQTPPESVMSGAQPAAGDIATVAALEKLPNHVANGLLFRQSVSEFHALVVARAKERGEYKKIPLEVSFYKAKFFSYAQVLFILSFLTAALSWLNMRSRVLGWLTATMVAAPWALLVTGIVYRCVIRGRPPISTLYETILFITAVSVFVSLFIESINRRRIAVSVGAFLGTLGMFIANRYEITNREDTMPMLVAVLDTNFWLATHVTIINVGYAAGMLAAGIAHVYVLGRLLGLKRNDRDFYRSLTRMVYGVTCFGLLFAFIGTVLGGIWANYSWGRFWGWDPKENGAALICLSMLATLHARMGGYLREMGLHLAAVFTGCVVAFSWWGVNLLGVGLHSYGFTDGIWTATFIFWSTQAAVIALGIIASLRDHLRSKSAGTRAPQSGDPAIAK